MTLELIQEKEKEQGKEKDTEKQMKQEKEMEKENDKQKKRDKQNKENKDKEEANKKEKDLFLYVYCKLKTQFQKYGNREPGSHNKYTPLPQGKSRWL